MTSSSEYQAIPMGTDHKPFTTPSIQHHTFLSRNGNNMSRILLCLMAIAVTAFVSSHYTRSRFMNEVKGHAIASALTSSKATGQLPLQLQAKGQIEDMCRPIAFICKMDPSYGICPVCVDFLGPDFKLAVNSKSAKYPKLPLQLQAKGQIEDMCKPIAFICKMDPSYGICPVCVDFLGPDFKLAVNSKSAKLPLQLQAKGQIEDMCKPIAFICKMDPSYGLCPVCVDFLGPDF